MNRRYITAQQAYREIKAQGPDINQSETTEALNTFYLATRGNYYNPPQP